MSIKALSEYTFYSRYSQRNKEEKRRETWGEAVERLYEMHRIKYANEIQNNPKLGEYINFAEEQQKKKRVLASQRSLQFASEPILKHELKMFNCLFTHIDRERVFQEMMYSLLCGCGVGFSVQTQHITQLGEFKAPEGEEVEFVVPDSIEGWANAIGVLMASWSTTTWGDFDEYQGKNVKFNFRKIRPEGTLIAGRFKAPGFKGLKATIKKIEKLLKRQHKKSGNEFRLRPIDAYDIIMHISDAVLSGGVRRSATLCMFSKDDKDMLNAKTGNWFVDNPQRARSNNSVALLRGHVSEDEFAEIMKSTREYGEPGFIWTDDLESGYNPCVTGDALIELTDGTHQTMKELVERIQAGEEVGVVSYNTETGKREDDIAKFGVRTRESANVIKLVLEDGREIKLTPTHRVLTYNRGYIEASKLTEEDDIVVDEEFDFGGSEYTDTIEATPVEYINQEKWSRTVVNTEK